jgi:hypothetical protein
MSALFRVLYSELFPKRAEVQYFSFQLAIACGTVWIPQVVDSAIVDATNLVRLPAGEDPFSPSFSSPRPSDSNLLRFFPVPAVALAMILVAIGLTFWTDIERGIRMVHHAELEGAEPDDSTKDSTL